MQKKVIVICGPTCAGKSRIALILAKILNTDIISIDSMQVYRKMNIGTDKYETSSLGIKQYMTDLFEPDHNLTVVEFRNTCRNILKNDFFEKNKIPVLTGGSGLYMRAVLDDLEFSAAAKEISAKEFKNGPSADYEELYENLKKTDPEYARKISRNDHRRIKRALDVYGKTGEVFSSFQTTWNERRSVYDCTFIGINMEKKILHSCIENRVEQMFSRGLVGEVENLIHSGYRDCSSLLQAVGYKEVVKHLKKEISLEECKEEIIKNTKKLAKKQLTWFRADPRIQWIITDNYDNIFNLIEAIINLIIKDLDNEKI